MLTKPLGVGAITTGIKQGAASAESAEAALNSMRTLNRAARDAVARVGPHACTDVTGFSLLGHLYQMLRASGASARVHSAQRAVPDRGVRPRASGHQSGRGGAQPGLLRRARHGGGRRWKLAIVSLLYDPQTSGGLLVSVAGDKRDSALACTCRRRAFRLRTLVT